ncbi:MAG: esterase-like activity of phytase family protein [Vicinamibacteria bacterium]
MRLLTRAIAVAFLIAAGCRRQEPIPESAPHLEVSFLGDALLSQGVAIDSLEVGGLSALSFSGEPPGWLALSDAHVPARLFEMEVDFDESRLEVAATKALPLRDGDDLDPEGLARCPWGNLFVSTEGASRTEPIQQPKLLEFDAQGALKRNFPIPEKFVVSGSPPEKGIRHNMGFESLGLSPDGTRLFVGVENTLHQDGPMASFETAGFSRIIVYQVRERELSAYREYVYTLGPFAAVPDFEGQEVFGGLVDMVALGNERLLALERVFIRELSGQKRDTTKARIYDVDLSEASDVSGISSLAEEADWRPATKELVLDLDDILPMLSSEYPRLDNLEGMGLGPELPGGGKALLLVSDDNFQKKQRTQFLLFRLEGG